MAYFNIFSEKMAWNSYIGAFGSSIGTQISCSGACSSFNRACISSSGQRLQSLEAPEPLSFSRWLAFSPSGATTLPHINYAWRKLIYQSQNLIQSWSNICKAKMSHIFACSYFSFPIDCFCFIGENDFFGKCTVVVELVVDPAEWLPINRPIINHTRTVAWN